MGQAISPASRRSRCGGGATARRAELPRLVYIRPTEQALRRSGAEGRDKDTKPVFIDLESYLSLEIFHRWLVKAGELEVTEMLPTPEHLCWQEKTAAAPSNCAR